MSKWTYHPHGKKPVPPKKPVTDPLTVLCKTCRAPVKVVEGVCAMCGEMLKKKDVKKV